MMKTISILGCGWMGLPCALNLLQAGYSVKGSTTSEDKLSTFQAAGIDSYLVNLDTDEIPSELMDCDILFITFPPGRGAPNLIERYAQRINKVIQSLTQSQISKVIFASTTGVYGADIAEPKIYENTPPNPQRDSAKAMHAAEQSLAMYTDDLTILRFAGLSGPGRKSAAFLAGKTDLPNPQNAVNLVHLDDCVEVVHQVIAQDLFGEKLNVVADIHPTREAYYTRQAERASLSPPGFSNKINTPNKIVHNDKLKKVLNYTFLHPDPNLFP